MLNFSNLNDVEFEYLCKDVMSRILEVKLQRFGSGRDGGVYLTEEAYKKNIIVQVKHYVKTDVAGLITSLKKEVKKVERHNPKQYYICCSKELTPNNKQDIYEMFSKYMDSTNNIISITEINDFLECSENADILQKHFKLWIESTNILTDIFTKDICIDSEVLMYDINESVKTFVKTSAYNYAISCLEKNNVLIIVGNPGVGKTITSQMLVLYYASQEYRVRYTTDGTDLSGLKKSLSQSATTKEIILLDDCFGQAYFNMKETQETELLSLIKYVKLNPNKVLIMNSRVTIFQEAQMRAVNLVKSIERKEYRVFVLDMNNISPIEKAKIFYNHLYFGEIPMKYRDNIKRQKKYIGIVMHKNYNPRIMEFVTRKTQYESVDSEYYSDFIMQCLDNPKQIWENEYERRLINTDRAFLNTLFSLSNTAIPIEIMKFCYEERLSKLDGIDLSINHFEQSLKRLQDSMIKIMDVNGKRMISVTNPSVNDFLSAHIDNNLLEKKAIVEAACSIHQLKRMLSINDYQKKLATIFENKSVLNYKFENEQQQAGFITYYCADNKILDNNYKYYVQTYVLNPQRVIGLEKISCKNIYTKLFEREFCLFYELDSVVCSMDNLIHILSVLELYNNIHFIQQIDYLFEGEARKEYKATIVEVLKNKITDFCTDVQAEEYDVDVGSFIEHYRYEKDDEGIIDSNSAIDEIDNSVAAWVLDDVHEYIALLPKDIVIENEFWDNLLVNVNGSSELVEAYLMDEYADDYYDEYREREYVVPEIEYIFER